MPKAKKMQTIDAIQSALIVVAQNFVCYDDTFMSTKIIAANLKNRKFWEAVADNIKAEIIDGLTTDKEGYDDIDIVVPSDNTVLDYIVNIDNRLELNDMVVDAVESWLKFKK